MNNEELLKLIEENKDLPIVFMVDNEELTIDYVFTLFENYIATVDDIFTDGEEFYNGLDDVLQIYGDRLSKNEGTGQMTRREYNEYVLNYVKTNLKHHKAIIVHCY